MKRVVAILLAALTLEAVPAGTRPASAAELSGFTATAEATGFSAQDGIPGFIIVPQYVDHGGPTSASLFESGGSQRAFASFPYPGYMVGLPGLAAVVAQSQGLPEPPVPDYPFYAEAVNPTTPEGKVGDPNSPYYLHAQAAADHVAGEARMGSLAGASPLASTVTSDVAVEGEKVVATASTLVSKLSLGPLSIESVRSESTTTYQQGSEKPASEAQLFVRGGKAGTMTFSYGPSGLQVADRGLPLAPSEGLTRLNQALEAEGLGVFFMAGEPLEGGKKAGVLEIVHRAPVPGAGTNIFRLRIGGAETSVLLGADSTRIDNAAGGAGAAPAAGGPVAPDSTASLPPMTPGFGGGLAASLRQTTRPGVPGSTAGGASDHVRVHSLGADPAGVRTPVADRLGDGNTGVGSAAAFQASPVAALSPASTGVSSSVAGASDALTVTAAVLLLIGFLGIGGLASWAAGKGSRHRG